jgi:hypothetical protein
MFKTIKGYFEEGQIILAETPHVANKTEVIVTFLSEDDKAEILTKRKPGGLKGKVVIPDDFNAPLEDLKDYM